MKISISLIHRCIILIGYGCCIFSSNNCCTAYQISTRQIYNNRRRSTSLFISTIDIEVPSTSNNISNNSNKSSKNDGLLQWADIIPISLFTTFCIAVAILVSTYEDYDVTHTRPSPSSLRLPTSSTTSRFNFIGAATKGMGSGSSNRGIGSANNDDQTSSSPSFEEWYGTSATTLQFKPSYNEIMLQHRTERIPRWNNNNVPDTTKEELQQAVLQLYKSIDELDELKLLADDYNWDGIKEYLNPVANTLDAVVDNGRGTQQTYVLPSALEYSMDILKTMPSYTSNGVGSNGKEVPEVIGLDWGSCAWRHCGAKADAQEAIAELYNNVGMLEPFECRFIIDVVERSIRDVLVVIPDDIKPDQQLKKYVDYVPQAQDDSGELGIDYEEYAKSRELARNAFDD